MNKFRVFMDGKMYYGEDFEKPAHQFMVRMDGTVWALHNIAYDLVEAHKMDAISMPWTGLQDKAGKDIWVGDTLRHRQGTGKFSTGIVTPIEDGAFRYKSSGQSRSFVTKGSCADRYEVIGNIYENPDPELV